MMCRKVLLPLPEGPIIATASSREIVSEISESTDSAPRGVGYSLERFRTSSNRQLQRYRRLSSLRILMVSAQYLYSLRRQSADRTVYGTFRRLDSLRYG